MKKLYNIIIGVAMATLFTACSQQGEAESIVKEFIEQNAIAPEKMEQKVFAHLDSTKVVRDSLIKIMQNNKHELYKDNIKYPQQTSGRVLYYLRMKYVYEGDTLSQTFYLDENLQHVVSFK